MNFFKNFLIRLLIFIANFSFVEAIMADSSLLVYDEAGNQTSQLAAALSSPMIISQPKNVLLIANDDTRFSVLVSSVGTIRYQWKLNGVDISGAIYDTLVVPNQTMTQGTYGHYSVAVSNEVGGVISRTVTIEPDSDLDGLGDLWEVANFGNLSRDGAGDFDGDGVSDRIEFLDGTDPKQPPSLSVSLMDGQIRIIIPSQIGVSYQLRQSVTLSPENWQDVEPARAGTGQPLEFNTLMEGVGMFYRVRIIPPP